MLRSVWLELTESDGDAVRSIKSRPVEEDALVRRWECLPLGLLSVTQVGVPLLCPAEIGACERGLAEDMWLDFRQGREISRFRIVVLLLRMTGVISPFLIRLHYVCRHEHKLALREYAFVLKTVIVYWVATIFTLLSVSACDWSFVMGPTSRWLDNDYCCYARNTDPTLSNYVCGFELPRPALYWNWLYRSRVEMCRLNMCAVGCRPVTAKNHHFIKIPLTCHPESAWIVRLSFITL